MTSLRENFEQGFEDPRQDSRQPLVAEVLAWSEDWAFQLQLWVKVGPEQAAIRVTPEEGPGMMFDLEHAIEQDQKLAELGNFRFRCVRDHPLQREQANRIVDHLLRDGGLSDDQIAVYQQVLPYKIAALHHLRTSHTVIPRVPVWLYKKDINADRSSLSNKDLRYIPIKAGLPLEKVKQYFHRISNSHLPLYSQWEYCLIQGRQTTRDSSNSGILRRPIDWYNISKQILAPENPYDAVIVYQTPDMHRPYQHPRGPDELRDAGMTQIKQLIDDAKIKANNEPEPEAPSASTGLLDVQKPSTSKEITSILPCTSAPETMLEIEKANPTQSAFSVPANRLIQTPLAGLPDVQAEIAMMTRMEESEDNTGAFSQDHSRHMLQTNEVSPRSRYITVWLEHDGIVDEYFDYPKLNKPMSTHKREQGKRYDTWYFQEGIIGISGSGI